jgi:uncharacterized membrane protein YkgB
LPEASSSGERVGVGGTSVGIITVAVGAGMIVNTANGAVALFGGRNINIVPIHRIIIIRPKKNEATNIPDVNLIPEDCRIMQLQVTGRKPTPG